MRIIPAIDIINGQCVRLSQGDYSKQRVYSKYPLEVAKSFEDAGVKYLHLVDLDGAKTDHIVNSRILEEICNGTSLEVDFGGGIKTDKDIDLAFNCGAKQVTVGSIAVKEPEKVEEWMVKYGSDKLILGADVKENRIAINGWKEQTGKDLFEFVTAYHKQGIRSLISTDIATDGMLQGPSFNMYERLVLEFPELRVIASGGISSVDDLKKLKEIGVSGVIIGKAIYEGKITLKELGNYVD